MGKKVRISESTLAHIIEESTRRAINQYLFEERVRRIVKESIESFGDYSQFEAEDKDDDEGQAERKPIHNPDGTSDMNNENQEEQELRDEVENFFDKDGRGRGVDIAPYAYKLYGVEDTKGEDTNDMKNARSKFMKCLNHEPNENGYPYSFDSSEINRLKSFISAGHLAEGKIRKKAKRVK